MSTRTDANTPSPLTQLKPREPMKGDRVTALIEDMKQSLRDAVAMDYFPRMEHNHDVRYSWWPGQTLDGRKWPAERRDRTGSTIQRLMPGQTPDDVFPWPGAADNRVRIVDQVIRERNGLKKLALARKQQRIGPRNLSPDADPQQRAVLWGQVDDYYEDIVRRDFRTAAAQLSDVKEEYGHGVIFVGWNSDAQTVERTMSAKDLLMVVVRAALEVATAAKSALVNPEGGGGMTAEGGDEPQVELTRDEALAVVSEAQARLEKMIVDDKQRPALVSALVNFDPAMPRDEATRLARVLRLGQPATYYAATPFEECPEWQALTPYIDVFYPATVTRLKESPWIARTEWVGEAELRSRIDTDDYDPKWVDGVMTKPGKTFGAFDTKVDKYSWVLSGGAVRTGVRQRGTEGDKVKEFQLLHGYYRANAIGNVRALYHTVLHGQVLDMSGLHECCEHTHGEYPFMDHVDPEAPFLLAAEGAGEKSTTHQNEIKVQRDMRCDAASLMIKPPVKVPWNAGEKYDVISPGKKIPMRTTQGMGALEPLNLNIDPKGSMEVEMTTMDAFNELWARGMKIDPVVKQVMSQTLVTDWLMDVWAVKMMSFKVIQQFAPDELKAAFIGGLPVNMQATREEIQGQVSLEMDFDVSDLNPDLVEARMEAIAKVLTIDNQGLLQRGPLLKGVVSYLLPAHYKLLVSDPNRQLQNEIADEQRNYSEILSGTQLDEEGSFVIGTNHAERLQVGARMFGLKVDRKGNIVGVAPTGPDGQPSRAQSIFSSDADVNARVQRRLKFHAFQVMQQRNVTTGKVGVEVE